MLLIVLTLNLLHPVNRVVPVLANPDSYSMKSLQDSYEACELQWQLYTKAGNQQMQANLYQEAQQTYQQAMKLAQLMLEEAKSNAIHPDAIHPYVVSCHNLTDCWLNLNEFPQAEQAVRQAFDQVIQVMTNQSLPHSLRLEAFKALKVVSFEIDRFYRTLNQTAQAEEFFERAIALAQEFLASSDFAQMMRLEDFRRSPY